MGNNVLWKPTTVLALLCLLGTVSEGQRALAEHEYHSFSGWYNNPTKPDFGSTEQRLGSRTFPVFGDGTYTQVVGRPDPLQISNQIFASGGASVGSLAQRTTLVPFMAQHLWHEILDMDRMHCPPEPLWIPVAKGDINFDPTNRGDVFIPFWRARYDIGTGQSDNVPRMFMNAETSWIDGSSIYGTSKPWADKLRAGVGGRLASSADPMFPAKNTFGLPMRNPPPPVTHTLNDPTRLYVFGNKRAHMHPGILALQILWYREHNFQAGQIAAANPTLTDTEIFFLARQIVIAEMQNVFYNDLLPNFMGTALAAYTGYKPSTSAGINTEFAMAFRYAETMIPPGMYLRDAACTFFPFNPPAQPGAKSPGGATPNAARLCNLYWNAQDIFTATTPAGVPFSLDNVFMGMVSQIAEAEDAVFVDDLRLSTFGNLEFSRRDLVAMNIQRGRDFGLPDFNTVRGLYGLQATTFMNLTLNLALSTAVSGLYNNNLTQLDFFVGGMVESNGNPGPTFTAIFVDTFQRLRDGDRFWFQNTLTGLLNATQIATIQATFFRDILLRNTGLMATPATIQTNPYIGPSPCMQPGQLSAVTMEVCKPLQTFDYYATSYPHIPIIVIALALYVGVLALAIFLFVIRRKGIETKLITNITNSISDFVAPDGTTSFSAVEETDVDGFTKLQSVFLTCKKGKLVMEDAKHGFLREVDARSVEGVMLGGSKDSARMLVRIPKEYDIFLEFSDSMRRHNFYLELSKIKNQQLDSQNVSVRFMRRSRKTKQMRKKELKRFFTKAIQGVVSRGNAQELDFPKDVYEEQLSRDEFADSFSIPKNSLFVQQLYRMVDKDEKGFVTFREFLDFMGIFYNGSSEEKLSFLFDLYDTDKEGAISRDALARMLQSNLEIANAQVIQKDSIKQMVDVIFSELGLEGNQKIKFKDFKEFMGRSGANVAIAIKDEYQMKQGKDAPKPTFTPPTTTTPDQYSTVFINEQMRAALQGKGEKQAQYYTVLFTPEQFKQQMAEDGGSEQTNPLNQLTKAYGNDGAKDEGLKSVETTPGVELNRLQQAITYLRDNRASAFILFIYIAAGAILFIERAYTLAALKEHQGFRRALGPFGLVLAKGAAQNCMFNYALLLLTMCRNIFTFLRSGKVFGLALYKYIPFDNVYAFHKLLAYMGLFWSLAHTLAHFVNFFALGTQPAENALCLVREYFWYSNELPSFAFWLFMTIPGLTGVLILIALSILHGFATDYARRNIFGAFWSTHHICALALYVLTVMHGIARVLAPPTFYIWMIPPAFLFLVDRCLTLTRQSVEVPVVEVELLPSGVTKIVYKRPDEFDYKAGQWIRIACSAIGSREFHPFTMTSAPHEKYLMNHIRAVGPWTNALRQVYNPSQIRFGALPQIFIDGPYGEGHQEWNSFEYVVMVGGGIGVTPFAAILKDIVHQATKNTQLFMKKAYFFWVCRNQKQFEWLVDIIRECEEKDIKNLLEVHIFITELQHKYDLRTTMLHICERTFQKVSKRSLFTGCKAQTHFGRPNFSHLLSQLQQVHAAASRVGVFSCGPPPLTFSVDDGVKSVNLLTGPRFHHHFENF